MIVHRNVSPAVGADGVKVTTCATALTASTLGVEFDDVMPATVPTLNAISVAVVSVPIVVKITSSPLPETDKSPWSVSETHVNVRRAAAICPVVLGVSPPSSFISIVAVPPLQSTVSVVAPSMEEKVIVQSPISILSPSPGNVHTVNVRVAFTSATGAMFATVSKVSKTPVTAQALYHGIIIVVKNTPISTGEVALRNFCKKRGSEYFIYSYFPLFLITRQVITSQTLE